ncbi:putative Kinase-like domain-containing protein [Seiridium cardinale]|uniref:non-specific serine/threonine protein kinase n=1 Tax=Seiridium cardinale TaxID=138064 RepID=A0ABR2X8I3_9PEZI
MGTFIDFVNRRREMGMNGLGEKHHFVPRPYLDDYWEHQKITDILRLHGVPFAPPHMIIERYLGVLSTLVYIGRVQYLSAFHKYALGDAHFPATRYPSQWPDESPYHREIWNAFLPAHWMFFPLELGREHLVSLQAPPERVLPWETEEVLLPGDAAKILKIEVPESCFDLPAGPSKRCFVLKRYYDEHHRHNYEREREALTHLHGRSSPTNHVIEFHGAFEQVDTMNLVLEYVESGDLLHYMKNTPPPQTRADIHALWTSISGILKGCYHIHQWTQHSQLGEGFNVVHQDFKPQNILIVKDASSRYEFYPKVADFGCSYVRKDPQGPSPDRHGNPTYSAPECSHHASDLHMGPDIFTPAADIFALGCILSEVAAWVNEGMDMVETYRVMRAEEIAQNPRFKYSEHSVGFHNGADVLTAVESMRHLITNSRPGDFITAEILRVVYNHMLVARRDRRESAKEVLSSLENILNTPPTDQDKAKIAMVSAPSSSPNVVVNGPATPAQPSHDHTRAYPLSSPTRSKNPPPISVSGHMPVSLVDQQSPNSTLSIGLPSSTSLMDNGASMAIPARKRSTRKMMPSFVRPTSFHSSSSSRPRRFSTMSSADGKLTINDILDYRTAIKSEDEPKSNVEFLITKLQRNLSHRDHVFFIDDTHTMLAYREELLRAFTALSYLAKLIDQDGIELIFASNPRKIWKKSKTKELLKILESHEFVQESGMMEDKLGELLDHKISERLPLTFRKHQIPISKKKEVSIFILTDACWDNDIPELPNAAGVKAPIERLMNKIENKGLNRTQVMIQFIRFGDNENGKRYLDLLDDFGQDTGRDMVDTRAVDGNVYAMFIGSLSPGVDGQKDSVGNVLPAHV